jgi:NAD(P)-dependent dehydrogenase (short-subunit alcohol dehydrogenase family)
MAVAFAQHGADLVLADLNTAGMVNTATQISRLGRRAVPVTCDVSEPEPIHALFARLDQEYGRIDVLGNVAGEGILGKPEEIAVERRSPSSG